MSTKKERRRIRLEGLREESRRATEQAQEREKQLTLHRSTRLRKKRTMVAIVALALALLVAVVAVWALSPGKYDDFAKCLSEKGVVMYGEDWCRYTKAQKAMFGKSFKYIKYVQKPDLKVRPTWVIEDRTYETVQSFERLSALTGCKI